MHDPVSEDSPSLTEQLQRFSGGDRSIAEAVLRKVLPELHRIAIRELSGEYDSSCFSPTELINEVWVRNLRNGGWQINSREHFYAIAALAMRQVLIDLARIRTAQRRGRGEIPISLNGNSCAGSDGRDLETMVALGILMERLEKQDPEIARIVDMHYFAGFTLEEIAEITGMTLRQVRHRWVKGRDWLKDGLHD